MPRLVPQVMVLVLVAGQAITAAQSAATSVPRPRFLWRSATPPTDDFVLALAIGSDGTIYSGTWIGNVVYGFGPDGTLRRTLRVGRGAKALAVGKDGTIYVGSGDYIVYAFAPDGTPQSNIVLRKAASPGAGGPVEALAIADDGVIYAAFGNDVCAVEPGGAIRWRTTTQAPVDTLTIGSNGTLYAGFVDTVLGFMPDGTLKSKFGVGVRPGIMDAVSLVTIAAGRNGTLYVGSRDRIVYAVDATNGAVKWTFKPRGTPFAVAEGPDGVVHVGSYDGNLYALDAESGKLRWRFSMGNGRWGQNPVHALALGGNAVIYAGVGNSVEAFAAHP